MTDLPEKPFAQYLYSSPAAGKSLGETFTAGLRTFFRVKSSLCVKRACYGFEVVLADAVRMHASLVPDVVDDKPFGNLAVCHHVSSPVS